MGCAPFEVSVGGAAGRIIGHARWRRLPLTAWPSELAIVAELFRQDIARAIGRDACLCCSAGAARAIAGTSTKAPDGMRDGAGAKTGQGSGKSKSYFPLELEMNPLSAMIKPWYVPSAA
ncbi:hypothetical protein GIY62_20125 [Burkholderia plantarii]|nr:hypothetical protein GIY62_20125 [Burkholderia plantarii]